MVRARRFILTALCLGIAGTLALIGASRADLVPGGGPTKSDCYAELSVLGARNPGSTGNLAKNNKVVLKCLPRTTPCPTATGTDGRP